MQNIFIVNTKTVHWMCWKPQISVRAEQLIVIILSEINLADIHIKHKYPLYILKFVL